MQSVRYYTLNYLDMIRKSFMVLALAAMMTACGGSDKQQTTNDTILGIAEAVQGEEVAVASGDTENVAGVVTEEAVPVEEVVEETKEQASSVSSQITEMLDNLEGKVTKFVSLAKKVKEGDVKAATELPAVQKEVSSILSKLQAKAADMTPEQTKRFAEIQQKFTAAE